MCFSDCQDGERNNDYCRLFVFFLKSRSSHLFVYIHIDHHRGGITASFPYSISEYTEVRGLFSVIRLVSEDRFCVFWS